MKAVAYRVGDKRGILIDIENSLEALQGFVGGYIEVVPTSHAGLVIVCNEEGAIQDLPKNRRLSEFIDRVGPDTFIRGSFLICRTDNDGNFRDVTLTDVANVKGGTENV